jgi:serine/threonine protein kinase
VKACPICGRLYPDDAGFCPVDGSELMSATNAPPNSSVLDPRLGTLLFERYHLRRVVADGGMGRVYEALDMIEKRNVAVKILHENVSRDPIEVERFRREFEISAELPHEHIAQVYDFRPTAEGSHALVMEFLFGEELRGTLERERTIPPARLVRMVSQVAIALDEAHARKFVHRDLKPDNIYLCQTPDGDIVKVLDFGSVKDNARGAQKLTVVGTTIGSPYYMSPEQAQALDTLDHRADIWSMGAIVFECVTGRVPFTGNTGGAILMAILTKEAPLLSSVAKEIGVTVPSRLDAVVERALRRAPSLRFQSMGAFADALGAAYGLEGDHLAWAPMREGDLADAIREGLAKAPAEATEAPSPEDSFFGGTDALAASVPPRITSSPKVIDLPEAAPEAPALGIKPRGGSNLVWIVALVVVVALIVVAVWAL